jgi:hypothetical protein
MTGGWQKNTLLIVLPPSCYLAAATAVAQTKEVRRVLIFNDLELSRHQDCCHGSSYPCFLRSRVTRLNSYNESLRQLCFQTKLPSQIRNSYIRKYETASRT